VDDDREGEIKSKGYISYMKFRVIYVFTHVHASIFHSYPYSLKTPIPSLHFFLKKNSVKFQDPYQELKG
jgi:hypothetical protein